MTNTKITIIEENTNMSCRINKVIKNTENFYLDDMYTSAKDALARVDSIASDFIIMDTNGLSVKDNYQSARLIRGLVNAHIIFYGHSCNEKTIEDCLSLDNVSFVSKALPLSDLRDQIQMMTSKKKSTNSEENESTLLYQDHLSRYAYYA